MGINFVGLTKKALLVLAVLFGIAQLSKRSPQVRRIFA